MIIAVHIHREAQQSYGTVNLKKYVYHTIITRDKVDDNI